MSSTRAVAMGLLFLAAVAYGMVSIRLLLGGAFYPSVLGGQVAIGPSAWPLVMGSAILAALIAIAARQQWNEIVIAVAFVAWLLLAGGTAVVTEPVFGVAIALNALVPLALLRPKVPRRSGAARD